ncbi:MAG: YgjV family protein [Sphaerochaetaceae bacterium]|nr:YgjV family protein [Sphaerochaetaceae bacterium]
MINFVVQLLGIVGLILMALSYQMKERKGLLFMQMFSNAFLVAHYALLGALVMVAMCAINIARSIVFIAEDKKGERNQKLLYVFLLISLVSGLLTWDGPLSLMVIVASLILTVALYCRNLTLMRILFLFPPVLYISYNIMKGSIGGVGNDLFCFISAIVALWRFNIKSKNNDKDIVAE